MALNKARIWVGGLVGGIVWIAWSFVVGRFIITDARYAATQNAGLFLKQPRYPFFVGEWLAILVVLSIIMAHLYAWSRQTLGPGPGTALKIGLLAGFVAGFPLNFAQATWVPISRMFPLGWMLEMWVGAILATLVAGFIYRE